MKPFGFYLIKIQSWGSNKVSVILIVVKKCLPDEEIASITVKFIFFLFVKILSNHNVFPFIIQVIYVPLSVIITTFKKENVRRPLEGFGVLVPSKEQQNGLKTLGNALFWPCSII